MTRVTPIDSGRLPYFFLLFNDQRRKLESLEANADLIRAEMLTPFFDMELLSLISAARIDEFIGHDLYVKWLQQFQFPVYSVAWQSYPGHVPCSVPVPADLEYQWHRKAYLDRRLAVHMVSRCLTPSSFPGWILRRDVVMAAGILTLLGVRNYGYLLDPARRFCEALAPKGQPQPNKHLIRPSTQGSARRP